jgi:hypothetical protein
MFIVFTAAVVLAACELDAEVLGEAPPPLPFDEPPQAARVSMAAAKPVVTHHRLRMKYLSVHAECSVSPATQRAVCIRATQRAYT